MIRVLRSIFRLTVYSSDPRAISAFFERLLLLGICFLSEVVESIMRGGDRGLRGKEGLKRVDIGKWAAVRQGGNR